MQRPPKSYKLDPKANTGETCCTAFWIKFNQRFALMQPNSSSKHADAIELALYNALLRQMGFPDEGGAPPRCKQTESCQGLAPGMRGMAQMEGVKQAPANYNTCCEAQGTRMFGSLPEYIYTISTPTTTGSIPASGNAASSDGFYVNMFVPSTLEFNATVVVAGGGGSGGGREAAVSASANDAPTTPPKTSEGQQPAQEKEDVNKELPRALPPPAPPDVL